MGISTHCNQILFGSFSQITHDNLYGIKINWFETRRCKSSKLLQILHTKINPKKKQQRSMAHRLKLTFLKALK